MELLALIAIPLVLAFIVMVCGFAGCGFPDPLIYIPASNLQAKATGPRKVELTWIDPNGTTFYFVERMDFGQTIRTSVGRTAGGALVDETSTLMDGTSYTYVVRPDETWANASDETNPSSVTTPPAPPGGLTATADGPSTINITWTGRTNFSYTLEHRVLPVGGFLPIYDGTTPSYSHTGLSAGTAHEYRVISKVTGLSGPMTSLPSNAVSATTAAAPGPPPPPATWKQAFAATLNANTPNRDGDCIVQRIAAPLDNGGTKVRVTLRGSTAGTLVLDAVTISQAGGSNLWSSAATPVPLKVANNGVITIAASTVVTTDAADYVLDKTKDQIIAFDINTPNGDVRHGPRAGTKAYTRDAIHEAGAKDRTAGYQESINDIFMIEKIEVM